MSHPILDPPTVSAEDRAFLLGDGLFETIRVYEGVPFRLDAHLDRLRDAARTVGILLPVDLEDRVRRIVPAGDAALRITVSRGRGGDLAGEDLAGEGAGADGGDEPTVALRLVALPPAGVKPPPALHAMLEGHLHEGALTATLKGVGYLERIAALRRARARGGNEALLRNTRGEVVEAAAANLVAVTREGRVVSPGPTEGALAGVTRQVVVDEAVRLGYEVSERGLEPDELPGLAALVATSSLREIAPVVRVEGHPVGHGRPGSHFRRLARAFRETVAREVAAGKGGPARAG